MTHLLARRLTAALLTSAVLCAALAVAPAVRAGSVITVNEGVQLINDNDLCSLSEAIYAANRDDEFAPDPGNPGGLIHTGCFAGNGADTILLAPADQVFLIADPISDYANYMGPSATPIITSPITIKGLGARFERVAAGRLTRAFVVGTVDGHRGDLTLEDVHLKGFAIKGGNGADGGGGGLGAGGAIYVDGGSLTVIRSTFEGNHATGGNGSYHQFGPGGGGGGLFGNGGAQGGGGGGARGDGAPGDGGDGDGGGGGGTVTSAVGQTPGEACGGAGGVTTITGSHDGDSADCAGGGGGGGSGFLPVWDIFEGGAGGWGNYGGGGGGSGDQSDGGIGGFGGGGGAAAESGLTGGDGGFGGGGGMGEAFDVWGGRGQGGTFAGDGGDLGGGGGGALGGAIFGSYADIQVINSTFSGNWVQRGRAGHDTARDGRGAGGAIFLVAGSLNVESSTIARNDAHEPDLGGGGIVAYKPDSPDNATSFVLRNSIVANNGPSECYTRNGVTVTGTRRNVITDSTTNSHDDDRCLGVASSVDPGLGPLQLNEPGFTPTMAIGAASSAADGAEPGGATPTEDQRRVSRLSGSGPDIGAYEASGAAPVTTIALSPAAPDGANGWYRTAVGLTISATDADGHLAQTRCALDPASTPAGFYALPSADCAFSSVAIDGQHTVFAGSVDAAGNAGQPLATATFNIDRTPPSLSPTLSSSSVLLGQAGVTASPNATDATSGVATSGCGAIDTSTAGAHTVSCTATDLAGNQASTNLTYVVEYRVLGFFSPVPMSKWKVGQSVPVKVAVANGAGTRLSDAVAGQLASACRATFTVSGAQTQASQCLKYDAANDQLIYTWKVGKQGTGQATIRVAIWYPGTTFKTQLSEVISITK